MDESYDTETEQIDHEVQVQVQQPKLDIMCPELGKPVSKEMQQLYLKGSFHKQVCTKAVQVPSSTTISFYRCMYEDRIHKYLTQAEKYPDRYKHYFCDSKSREQWKRNMNDKLHSLDILGMDILNDMDAHDDLRESNHPVYKSFIQDFWQVIQELRSPFQQLMDLKFSNFGPYVHRLERDNAKKKKEFMSLFEQKSQA